MAARRDYYQVLGVPPDADHLPGLPWRGQVIDQPCRACDGSGQVVQEDEITIRIPRGVPEGTALRLGGQKVPAARDRSLSPA